MPSQLNHTVISLIPKVKQPESMKDLRPMSLCNVTYMLISKVVANRLKSILPRIIDVRKSAFVPGRLITDNFLVVYECFHFMKTKKTGRKGWAAAKLDMSKTYDRVEWGFVEHVMRAMGFPLRWI